MILIFLLILISVVPLPEIAGATGKDDNGTGDGNPMAMFRTTLKTWHSMYNFYREEIGLGYCWADYFIDVKRILNTLTGPRLLGLNSNDPSPLIAVLKNWFDDEKTEKSTSSTLGYNSLEENYDDYDCGDQELSYNQGTQTTPCSKWNSNSDQFVVHQQQRGEEQPSGYNGREDLTTVAMSKEKPFRYFYPGVENFGGRSESSPGRIFKSLILKVAEKYELGKWKSRDLGDFFVSILGLNVPPGVGPLMLGVRSTSSIMIIISRMIGTFVRVGRQVLNTIETTSILACSKEYLLVKFFRWIDS